MSGELKQLLFLSSFDLLLISGPFVFDLVPKTFSLDGVCRRKHSNAPPVADEVKARLFAGVVAGLEDTLSWLLLRLLGRTCVTKQSRVATLNFPAVTWNTHLR